MEGWVQDTQRAPTDAGQEPRPGSEHSAAGLPVRRTSWGGSWLWLISELAGTQGNVGLCMILSPLPTPAPAQEAELAPSLPSVIWPKEPTAGADLQTAPYPEGRPTSSVLPPPSPAPAEVLEPGPAYAAAPDLTEALRPWPKEPSLEPAPGPAREEENAPAPVLEPLVVPPALPFPSQFVLPPRFELILIFMVCFIFVTIWFI